MQDWYLLQSKPKQEELAYQNIVHQGYEAYLPKIAVEKIYRGKRSTKHEPLFRRYLFVRLDNEGGQSWAPLRSTIGVAQLVRFGNHFARLTDALITNLQERIDALPLVQKLQAGDPITISEGPFYGLEAVFKCYDGNQRAMVLLQHLNNGIQIKVSSFPLTALKQRA